jgi:Flp pilus assembly protein TadD
VAKPPAFELVPPALENDAQEALAHGGDEPAADELAALRRAAEAHPEDPDYWFMLGIALARRGEHEAAVPALREALRFPTADPAYRRSLAVSLHVLGRDEEALREFDALLRDHPQDHAARGGRALALLRLGRSQEAVAALRGVVAGSDRADSHSNLGAALWAAGNAAEAERRFRHAVRLAPRVPAYHRNLGLALLARGKAAWAAACFRDALELDPKSAAAAMDLGDALFAGKRHAEAEAAYEQGLALDPAAAVARESTRAAWAEIRKERARGELPAKGQPADFVTRATSRAFDTWHHFEPWLDFLGTRGRRAATLGVLLLVVLLARAALVVWPHYVTHHQLQDEVVRLSRTPTEDDALVREQVLAAVRRFGREPFVNPEEVLVRSDSRYRRVSFRYEVQVALLPGIRAPLRFAIRTEEPYFVEKDPILL